MSVWLDSELTMHDHNSRTASSCFFHLRRLRQLRGVFCRFIMQRLVSALVLSRLNYCNAMLSGLPSMTLDSLQQVLNAAVCLVTGLGPLESVPRDHTDEGAPLVTNQILYQFQVMSDDARRCDWSMPAIHS